MRCALCGCELKGFADGEMIERRVTVKVGPGAASRGTRTTERVLVCRDDDGCGKRRAENEKKAGA